MAVKSKAAAETSRRKQIETFAEALGTLLERTQTGKLTWDVSDVPGAIQAELPAPRIVDAYRAEELGSSLLLVGLSELSPEPFATASPSERSAVSVLFVSKGAGWQAFPPRSYLKYLQLDLNFLLRAVRHRSDDLMEFAKRLNSLRSVKENSA